MNIISIDPETNQQRILGKDARFWLVIIGIVAAILVALNLFLSFALVHISYNLGEQVPADKVELSITSSSGVTTHPMFLGSYAFIPRSTSTITAQTSNSQTVKTIASLPYFKIPAFNLTLQAQQTLSNQGSQTLGCNLVNSSGVFTHNCTSISEINKIDRPTNGMWGTVPERAGYQGDTYKRYKAGYLALQDPSLATPKDTNAPLRLEYTIPGGQTQFINLPKDFSQNTADNVAIVTDQANQATDAFVIANLSTGKFLYMPSWQQAATATAFSRTTQIDTKYTATLCTMSGTQLSCYYGPYQGSNDFESQQDYKKYQDYSRSHPGKLELTTLPSAQTAVYSIKNLDTADNIYQSTSTLYLQNHEKLYQLSIGKNADATLIAANVNHTGPSLDTLYYTAGDSLFQHLPSEQTTYLRFHSENLTALNPSIYGDQILLNSFINAPEGTELRTIASVYQLTPKKLPANQKHIQDILPYRDENLGIAFMDYDDTRIYISMQPVYSTDLQTGIRTINSAALKDRQNRIVEKLRQDALADNHQLIFR